MSSISFAVLALSLSAPAAKGADLSGSDWPQWQGPNRDAHSTSTGLLQKWPAAGPKLVFKTDKIGVGYAAPAVAHGKLIVCGAEDAKEGDKEFVLCLDSVKGNEIWRTPVETSSGKYNFGYGNGPRSTPTIDGDRVYILGAKGDLLCLNLADGKRIWSKNLVKDMNGGIPGWGYSESVLIDGEKLVCTPGGSKGTIAALDKKDGKVIWRSEELKDGAGYSSIIIAEVGGIKQYITQTMQSACGVRPSDGKLLWRREDMTRKVAVIPTPVFYKDHVFVTAGYGAGCELINLTKDGADKIKSEKVYTDKVITNHHGGVVRVGEFLYGHSDQGDQWVCLPFLEKGDEDGPKPAWTSKKLDKGSVSYADGHLYCYGQGKGDVVLVRADPKDWIEDGRFTIPEHSSLRPKSGKVWAHPVIANGKLYLRDFEWLFCFDVAAKE
jgi:outer membrane protein assembly factor BamB